MDYHAVMLHLAERGLLPLAELLVFTVFGLTALGLSFIALRKVMFVANANAALNPLERAKQLRTARASIFASGLLGGGMKYLTTISYTIIASDYSDVTASGNKLSITDKSDPLSFVYTAAWIAGAWIAFQLAMAIADSGEKRLTFRQALAMLISSGALMQLRELFDRIANTFDTKLTGH